MAAQFEYAVMLLQGRGLAKDRDKAVPYLQAAAAKGMGGAQNRLAHLYAEGIGVKKDAVEAAKWRLVAQASGLADERLDQLVGRLSRADRLAAEKAAAEMRDQTMLVE